MRGALVMLAVGMLVAPAGLAPAGSWEPGLAAGPEAAPAALPPGSDLCTDPAIASLCPTAGIARAGCGAAGLIVRGLLPFQLGNTLTNLVAPAGPQSSENHVVDGGVAPLVETDAVNGRCDVDARGRPEACGTADASQVVVNLPPLYVGSDALRMTTCSSIPASGFSDGLVEGLVVSAITKVNLPLATPPNTVIPLLGIGYIVLNEQAGSNDGTCQRNSGSAMRVVVLEPLAEVVVGFAATAACKLVPTIGTTSSPTGPGQAMGVQARDTAMVTGTGGIATGAVEFHLCAPGQTTAAGCPAGGSKVGATKTLGGGVATSDLTAPLTAMGDYCWRAQYGGDGVYVAASHTNAGSECFKVEKPTPTISTAVVQGAGPFKPLSFMQDRATLGGAFGTPTGTVTFHLCAPAQVTATGCPSGGTLIGTTALAGGIATSPATSATTTEGRYCWRAQYNGDATYNAVTHTNADTECFTIDKATPSLATHASTSCPTCGNGQVNDRAWVNATSPLPTGTVTFFLCPPALVTAVGCPSGGNVIGTVALSATANGATALSPTSTFDGNETEGTYCYRAVYSGDAAYDPVAHTNRTTECFTVVFPQ